MPIKKFVDNPELFGDAVYYVGERKDIKAIYKSICRNGSLWTFDSHFANNREVYGLSVEGSVVCVINSDVMLYMILSGEVIPF